MNITVGYYLFHANKIVIDDPIKITSETEKCLFTSHNRYLKSNIGIPILNSVTTYPYIKVAMVDANEEEVKQKLASWFSNKAKNIENGNIKQNK